MDLSLAVPPVGPALSSGQYAELSERIGNLPDGIVVLPYARDGIGRRSSTLG